MARKGKWLVAIAAALAGTSCLGLGGGIYIIFYGYPAWANERFVVADRIDGDGPSRRLTIGGITHGQQFLEPADEGERGRQDRDFSRVATTYYHRDGPLGLAMSRTEWFSSPENTYWADARLPASLVGLGMPLEGLPLSPLVAVWSERPYGKVTIGDGAMASYARPYQWVDFYERNPAIIALSVPPNGKRPQFSFVRDARQRGANVRILEGPERKTIAAQGPKNFYHVLVVDLFRGRVDIASQELMTREAMALFLETLTEDGLLVVHTSSRDYNLAPPLADAAHSLGLICFKGEDRAHGNPQKGRFASEWLVIARDMRIVGPVLRPGPLGRDGGVQWQHLPISDKAPWTDASTNWLWSLRR